MQIFKIKIKNYFIYLFLIIIAFVTIFFAINLTTKIYQYVNNLRNHIEYLDTVNAEIFPFPDAAKPVVVLSFVHE